MKKIFYILIFSTLLFINIRANCPRDIIILIDNSGSMNLSINWLSIKQSLDDFIDQALLVPGTRIAVAHYGMQGLSPRIYIENDFTSDALIAKNFLDRQAQVGMGDYLSESMLLIGKALDGIPDPEIVSPTNTLNQLPTSKLGILIYTDALRSSFGVMGSALVSSTDFANPFIVFNDFKLLRDAEISLVHITPPFMGHSATDFSAAAAISSVGYTYSGPVEPNLGDPEGSGVTPRRYIQYTTYSLIPADVISLAEDFNCGSDFTFENNCLGDSTVFSSIINPVPDSVFWDFGVSTIDYDTSSNLNPTFIFPDTGTFTVSLYSWTAGIADTSIQQITIYGNFFSGINDTIICNNNAIYLIAESNLGSSYLWNDGSVNDSILINTPGNYWINVTYKNCEISDSIFVDSNSIYFTLGLDTILCPQIPYSITPNYVAESYLWNTGQTSNSIIINSTGTYWLQATSTKGCKYTDSINIFIYPNYLFIGNDTTICENEGSLEISANYFSNYYIWSNGDTTKSIIVNKTGEYWVILNDSNNCELKDTILIRFNKPNIELNKNIVDCLPENFILSAENSSFISYLWNTGATEPFIETNENGEYWVEIKDIFNCKAKESVFLVFEDCDIFIPNIFSPNGDGFNDTFLIPTTGLTKFELKIFNRWGKEIYSKNSGNIEWNGINNNDIESVDGVYYYILYASVGKKKYEHSGHVTLVR